MNSPITASARAKVRARFARDMIDTVLITRGGIGVFDPLTGNTPGGASAEVYHGPARLPLVAGAGQVALGEGQIKMRQVECQIPWNAPIVYVNDVVSVETAQDPQLVATTWRVINVDGGGSWAALRTLSLSGWYPDTTTWTGAP